MVFASSEFIGPFVKALLRQWARVTGENSHLSVIRQLIFNGA